MKNKGGLTRRGFVGVVAGGLGVLAHPGFAMSPSSPETVDAIAIGHSTREDDLPSIASAPDGSVWAGWLSFNGERDDVAIRHFRDGNWENIHWVPATSGDNWFPQVAVDRSNRVWVIWSQQSEGKWNIYARRFDPQE